jgi:phosphoribosyl 1,2-cyclic phosphodiesterase
MNLRWAILGSGSLANSYFFQAGEEALVIDNGYPLRTFRKRAIKADLDPALVKTVMLTHTHGDHVRGLENLLMETGAVLVHRRGLKVESVIRRWKEPRLMAVEAQTSYRIGNIDFLPFDLSHDAPTTGYHFKIGGVRFTLMTDTGRTDETMLRLAARSDILFLEANYCPVMLESGPYPAVLRHRVSGDTGHLSNHQAAAFLNDLADLRVSGTGAMNLRQVYLVHLSENNNTPERVAEVLRDECRWPGPVRVCHRNEMVLGASDHEHQY